MCVGDTQISTCMSSPQPICNLSLGLLPWKILKLPYFNITKQQTSHNKIWTVRISLQITMCILHTFCECNKLQKLLLSDSLSLPQCYQHFEYRVWQHHCHTEILQLLDLTARYTTNNKLSKQPVHKQGSTTKVIMYIFNNPLELKLAHCVHTVTVKW
jgi:hypothetical protein